MIRGSMVGIVASAGLALSSPALSQNEQRPANSPTREEAIDRFLEEKKANQADVIRELRDQGVSYGQVRSLMVKFRNLFRANPRVLEAGQAEEVNEVFLTDVAIELAVLGFGPSDLRNDDRAQQLFRAAVNKRKALANSDDLTLLSQAVIEGTVAEYVYEFETGPSPIFMVVDVTGVTKGDLKPGDRIKIPLLSKRVDDNVYQRDSSETLPEPGSALRAYLSESAKRFRGPSGRKFDGDSTFIKIADVEEL